MDQQVAPDSALADFIASLADNKHFLGRRYAEWCTAAPALESAVAAAAMAQDEIGHARSLYPLLKDIAGPSSDVEPETRAESTRARLLAEPFRNWPDFVAANYLFDTALTLIFENARYSSLGPLAQRARRIVEEENLHWLHAEGWTRRLSRSAPGVRAALADSLQTVAPEALACLVTVRGSLVERGIVLKTGEALLDEFRDRVNAGLRSGSLPTI